MRLEKFLIQHYKSIENIVLNFPKGVPLILFGSNNAGKSNILTGINKFLGDKYPTYVNVEDNDYFMRDSKNYPEISFEAQFDYDYYPGNRYSSPESTLFLTLNKETNGKRENIIHNKNDDKIFLSNEDRAKCQTVYTEANRDISRQLSYFSQYSMLSKMSKKMHSSLISSQKNELDELFSKIKEVYEKVEDYQSFYKKLKQSFDSNVDGFEHILDIDFSAYDPNNYFQSLRIVSKEGTEIRSFDEFGTGEQQILLMSFIKAYAETFNDENFIFIVEEPEAHLHPLAQRWLFKNLINISSNSIQVIISTHSPEFLDIKCLEGFVKVYKEDGVTKIIQNTKRDLVDKCIELGVPKDRINESTILEYYRVNTFYDELKGFFARKIILVEGATELFSLPYYFERMGYDLSKNGIEIINCRGKTQILRNYRLFKSYGYEIFCLFDGDKRKGCNFEFAEIFEFNEEKMNFVENSFDFDSEKKYGYFGKDFESYMKSYFETYEEVESRIEGSKVLKAKIIAEEQSYEPEFIRIIAEALAIQ